MHRTLRTLLVISQMGLSLQVSAGTGTDGESTALKADDMKVVAAGELV